MSTHYEFTPSVTATLGPAPSGGSSSVELPAVDGANVAIVLQNVGPAIAHLFPGTSPGGVSLAGAPDVVRLQPGETRFFATHPGFSSATVASLESGSLVTFSRGSVAPAWLFAAPVAAVF